MMRDGLMLGEIAFDAIGDEAIRIRTFYIRDELRGQGYGHLVMREISEAADMHGVCLTLEAFWRPDKDDGGYLVQFYRSHGLIGDAIDDQGYLEMTRQPAPSISLTP